MNVEFQFGSSIRLWPPLSTRLSRSETAGTELLVSTEGGAASYMWYGLYVLKFLESDTRRSEDK